MAPSLLLWHVHTHMRFLFSVMLRKHSTPPFLHALSWKHSIPPSSPQSTLSSIVHSMQTGVPLSISLSLSPSLYLHLSVSLSLSLSLSLFHCCPSLHLFLNFLAFDVHQFLHPLVFIVYSLSRFVTLFSSSYCLSICLYLPVSLSIYIYISHSGVSPTVFLCPGVWPVCVSDCLVCLYVWLAVSLSVRLSLSACPMLCHFAHQRPNISAEAIILLLAFLRVEEATGKAVHQLLRQHRYIVELQRDFPKHGAKKLFRLDENRSKKHCYPERQKLTN